MKLSDIVWIVLIAAGAVYLLYRSIRKNRGHCPGCNSVTCDIIKKTKL